VSIIVSSCSPCASCCLKQHLSKCSTSQVQTTLSGMYCPMGFSMSPHPFTLACTFTHLNPLRMRWGQQHDTPTIHARLATRMHRLVSRSALCEHAITLGHSIELSTMHAYNSHLQSYLSFCKIHDIPIEPTPDTLSFFVIFVSHYIKPSSVATYLSGICNCLKPHFPDVCSVRNSPVITRSLTRMKKLHGFSVPLQKRALSVDDISSLLNVHHSGSHDDLLFPSMLLTGFSALLHLGEMTVSNSPAKHSSKKITLHHTLSLQHDHYSFQLPFHKADWLYQGSNIIVLSKPASP
jgi:hypothetical protein